MIISILIPGFAFLAVLYGTETALKYQHVIDVPAVRQPVNLGLLPLPAGPVRLPEFIESLENQKMSQKG